MTVRIDRAVSSGTHTVEGQRHGAENNSWVVGNDHECVVVDAAIDITGVLPLVNRRRVAAILATHAHEDHIRAAPELSLVTGAPIFLHSADLPLWRHTHDLTEPDSILTDNLRLLVAGTIMQVIHTPGHTPGSCCLHLPTQLAIFSGDTLLHRGPGSTGRSLHDFRTIARSIDQRLLTLPATTTVHPGHGPDTTIGAERQRRAVRRTRLSTNRP